VLAVKGGAHKADVIVRCGIDQVAELLLLVPRLAGGRNRCRFFGDVA
jgi:hypothetical protein